MLHSIAAAILLAGFTVASHAVAAPAPKRQLRQQQGELRGRIDTLRRDLARSEESRADMTEHLRETESAISTANRELHRLAEQQGGVQGELRDLESQSRRLAEQTAARQQQLSRLLYRHFTRGETGTLTLLLGGHDPNQAALDHQFLKRLSMAQAEVIADLRDKTREKKRLGELTRRKSEELASIEQERKQARAALVDQQRQRQELLARTADRIKVQRREIGALQKDEQRLAKLIETLGRATRKLPSPATPATTAARLPGAARWGPAWPTSAPTRAMAPGPRPTARWSVGRWSWKARSRSMSTANASTARPTATPRPPSRCWPSPVAWPGM